MPAKNRPTESAAARTLVITRTFNAPRALVYRAWTEPKHMEQWWGPAGFTTPRCEADARVGGAIRIDMRAPDGTVHPMSGIYRELIEPERIVFEASALDAAGKPLFSILKTVTLADVGGRTELKLVAQVLNFRAEGTHHLEGMEAGWNQSLDRFAAYLPSKLEPLVVERTFDAPVARVWTAISTKEGIRGWSFDVDQFEPKVGCTFQFTAGKGERKFTHLCRVTQVVPERKLAYTWRYEGEPGNSLVTFELFPEGGKTRLRLTHEGLETFPQDANFAKPNFMGGWILLLGAFLKEYVEVTSG